MTNRVLASCVATLLALGLGAAPAAAQDADPYDPQGQPPPEADPQDPGYPGPPVEEYPPQPNGVPPYEAHPPAAAQQCVPCEQQPAAPPAPHHGTLLLAYVGANVFAGKGALNSSVLGTGMSVDPGLRLGGLLGGFVTPRVSVSGELTIDLLNTDDYAGYWKTGGTRVALAASPLFHVPASRDSAVELALGPKLGYRWTSISSNGADELTIKGYLVGFNAGVFVRGGAVMLGGLLSFDVSKASQVCIASCDVQTDAIDAEKVLSLAGSVLY